MWGRASVLALMCLAVAASAACAFEQAGVSAAVRGDVERANVAQPVGIKVKSGEPIYLADRITSRTDSGMQIMLLDQTTFTIGPDSFVTIDEFVYDPKTNAGKVAATLGKGVFRFVTGKIAQRDPENMTVKLPMATIGIRGTMVVGRTDQDRALVGLVGPGIDNNTGERAAGIDVITPQGTVSIRRPGWGARIERGKPPVVVELDKPDVLAIFTQVAPRLSMVPPGSVGPGPSPATTAGNSMQTGQAAGGQSTGGQGAGGQSGGGQSGGSPAGGQGGGTQGGTGTAGNTGTGQGGTSPVGTTGSAGGANQASGQGSASGLGNLASVGSVLPIAQTFNQATTFPAQQGLGSSPTTFGQLLAIQIGTFTFSQTGIPIGGAASGTYDFAMSINFGSQLITANFVNINVVGFAVAGGTVVINAPFDTGPPTSPVTISGGNPCGNAACSATVSLINAGSSIAKQASHQLTLTFSTSVASGSGIATRP